jgi:DNA polymerase type B, organellar and viral
MKKYTTINKWIDYYYNLENTIITNNSINLALFSLFHILNKLSANHYILIQFKIKTTSGHYRSISYVQTIKLSDFELLSETFIEFWNIKSEEYFLEKVSDIIFTYKILPLESDINTSKMNKHYNIISESRGKTTFFGYNLPNTMDFSQWGYINYYSDQFAYVAKANYKAIYHINIFDNYTKVELKLKDKILISFTDTMNDKDNLDSFTRTIKRQEYIFRDSKLIIKKIIKDVPFLKPLKASIFKSDTFLVMDLETRNINNIMIPYCISIYDGKTPVSFYLTEYKNSDEMLTTAVNYLMKRKYNQYKIFLHNLSYFDGIFLIKIISDLSKTIKPIIRDGRIIDLNLQFNNNKSSIYFRDSYLLLPASLKKLAINFKVQQKGLFPHLFVNNSDIDLNYIGKIPEYKYFNEDEISLDEYNNYCTKFNTNNWNLKSECIKYCEQDCISLYQVINEFNKQIFKLFRLDILKYPTLSSLAFGIFRTKILGDSQIPLIDGDLYHDIKKGYTGGSVDVYKPYGEQIYRYDVNSLYPYVMKEYPMPTGHPTYFEGDISQIEKKPFGIFEVEVESPKDINIPLLQLRYKTNNGVKTIAPKGKWISTYLSEELYNASNYGYTFKILKGYLFDKEYIFKDYVDFLYNIKVNSSKESPDYIISKMLLNSLYGRFGMTPEIENHMILSNNEALKIYNKYEVRNVCDFNNGRELLSYFDGNISEQRKNLNISIPISLAVTSYARIHMSQFKTMKDINLYYTDTDSIDINKPLEDKYIGKELGKMKLEHIFDKILFLAPKVYSGVTSSDTITKIKGFKNYTKFENLLPLLNKNEKLELHQDKWFRYLSKGHIEIKDEIYTLKVKDNKRKFYI